MSWWKRWKASRQPLFWLGIRWNYYIPSEGDRFFETGMSWYRNWEYKTYWAGPFYIALKTKYDG